MDQARHPVYIYIFIFVKLPRRPLSQSRVFLMSSSGPPALQQQIHRLNRSSPGFHDQLSEVLYGEEYRHCVPDLRGDDLVWLIDYLDKVYRHVTFPCSTLKPAQAFDGLDPSSATSRKCLRELGSICGARGILPTSYTLSSQLLNVGPDPFASGGYGDVYKGTLDGEKVCVKRVRVYLKDDSQRATKVCYRHCRPSRSLSLTKIPDLLPRGRNVETPDPPKYCTAARCHHHSLPAHFELDGRRGPAGVPREESRRESAWTRKCSSCCVYPPLSPVPSYLTSLGASATSTLAT